MGTHLFNDTDLTAIANAIRQKDGTQTTMTVGDMPTRIQNIPSGGGTDYMAERCQGTLSSYTIPNTVTQISAYSFYKMPISSITIPSSVTNIGVRAFYEAQLTTVFLPRTLTYIDQYAFSYQHDKSLNPTLTSITFDDNMNLECATSAFADNSKLTTLNNFKIDNFKNRSVAQAMFNTSALVGDISLGDSATVSQRAFNNTNASGFLYIHLTQTDASALTSSYSFGTGTSITTRSFNFDHCKLVVPAGMLSDYQSAFPNYSSIMIEETT